MALEEVERKLNYEFKDKKLLERALTHVSASKENYERIEFLGDSLVNFLIVDILYESFPQKREGELSSLKGYLVSEDFLYQLSLELELFKYVKIGGRLKERTKSILADVFESLWGALYLDSKDLNLVRKIFREKFLDRILKEVKEGKTLDYKTKLQEVTQKRWRIVPTYKLLEVKGPEHDRTFKVECRVLDFKTVGIAKTKKEAERLSAREMLKVLGEVKG